MELTLQVFGNELLAHCPRTHCLDVRHPELGVRGGTERCVLYERHMCHLNRRDHLEPYLGFDLCDLHALGTHPLVVVAHWSRRRW